MKLTYLIRSLSSKFGNMSIDKTISVSLSTHKIGIKLSGVYKTIIFAKIADSNEVRQS